MTSIDKTSSKRLSEIIIAESEEDFDVVCDFCLSEGKRVEAVGFCKSCQEHLCIECKKIHKKTTATRNHDLQDPLQKSEASVGKKAGHLSLDDADPIEDRCPEHPEILIEFFCHRHQQLACNICVPLHHRTCDDSVSYIPDISEGKTQSDELLNTLAELKKLIATLEASKTHTKWCQQQIEKNYNQLVSEIKQCRQRISQHFDRLEKELLLEASRLRKEKTDSLTSQMPACDIFIGEIMGFNCDLNKNCDLNHNSQVFIALQAAKEKIKTWKTEANKISRSAQAIRFVFRQDARLVDVTSVYTLGTVSVNEFSSGRSKFLQDINIKLATDKNDCNITGIAALAGGGLAITDCDNLSVKLVDTAACKVTESVSLTSAPQDITVMDGEQLAVVLNGPHYIQLLNLSPNLSLSHTLPVPGGYFGITYSEGNFILACWDPVNSVHICDRSGQLLRQIDTDNRGSTLFTFVSSVAVSPDQSTIYISDFEANKVVCLYHEGVVMATYSHNRLRCPWGVAVDDSGCVLVCSRDDHSVHQLDREGQLITVLLQAEDGLTYPYAVAHSNNTIYISSASDEPTDNNTIKAFTLEQ